MAQFSGNKGEWSETYALLKALSEGNLQAGDENLDPLPDILYPVIQIIRQESKHRVSYSVNDSLILISGEQELSVPIHQFGNKAKQLLDILLSKKKSGAFEIPELESFLRMIQIDKLTAKATKKSDIVIQIYDGRTGQTPELGFSIKSQIGSAATLLNASKATNFTFKVDPGSATNNEILALNHEITSGSKLKKRLNKLHNLGGNLKFVAIENRTFDSNLKVIDSCLPKLLASLIYDFYSSKRTSLRDLVEQLEQINPLQFDQTHNHPFYHYKFKRLLVDSALGMTPATAWQGKYDATGGYLVIRKNGDMVCYVVYRRNEFEDYLFNNTKLETPSNKKHGFGEFYERDNNLFIKLNLQIRFRK